jgi:hypothetical protein
MHSQWRKSWQFCKKILTPGTTDHEKVQRAHELKVRGLKPADIGKIIGASRATVYRYLSMEP